MKYIFVILINIESYFKLSSFGVIPLEYLNECDSITSPINTLTEANDQKVLAKRVSSQIDVSLYE